MMSHRLFGLALLLGSGGLLCGQVIDDSLDPLHGYCGGVAQCVDNGTNSPTDINPPTNFGFTISPGPATGILIIDVLVPDNEQTAGASYAITGAKTGTATLVSATEWTSGMLDGYLGLSASPANPIGAFLPSTQTLDSAATGFSVYQVNLGTVTLQGASNPNISPLLNISAIPIGSYIVGFLNKGTVAVPKYIATANSGAIFEDAPDPVPEPTAVALLGTVLVALGSAMRKKLS